MASFIIEHMDEILREWEAFAGTQTPAADTMDVRALRDHAREMLETIARDIQTSQTGEEQDLKSKGLAANQDAHSAAATHGALRQQGGFDLGQLVAEFRALRASVLRIWLAKEGFGDSATAYEMARFNEAIDQALAESVATYSSELARSRDTFLAILGHDLRTPLGAMWGAVEILAKSKQETAKATAYGAANRSLAAMGAMIRDLLDYTRTRLGKGIPIAPDTANLERVCAASVEEMSLAHPGASFAMTAEGDTTGAFDRERMHQVVSNLLGNAVQHAEPGSQVVVRTGIDDETLWLGVTNRGPLIAPEHLHSIFDPLVQLVPGAGERASNLGLGLFIAREIVMAHGGHIEASSSAELGTTFAVKLPRRRVAQAA
jgi:signal transduction histidine kinase